MIWGIAICLFGGVCGYLLGYQCAKDDVGMRCTIKHADGREVTVGRELMCDISSMSREERNDFFAALFPMSYPRVFSVTPRKCKRKRGVKP